MLDINIIREQPELVRKALADRQIETTPVDQILELDLKRRQTIQESESLKAERNAVSKEIGKATAPAERQAKIETMRQVGERISQLDEALRKIENKLNAILACRRRPAASRASRCWASRPSTRSAHGRSRAPI